MDIFVFEEKYRLNNLFKKGRFYETVFYKHRKSFGEDGANFISANSKEIYDLSQKTVVDPTKNNNILLVGKVQSGKTANLLMLTAMAFDNSYDVVVVYGGYDNGLLSQTKQRFIKTFDVDPYEFSVGNAVVYSTLDEDKRSLIDLDSQVVKNIVDDNGKIIILSLKRPVALGIVNDFLLKIKDLNLRTFIIDDEGDQAGLNNKNDKENEASSTYEQIVKMKNTLGDPLYFSVTATPHANIFLNSFSKLRPDTIKLIRPSKGYTGADSFHINSNNVCYIENFELIEKISNNKLPTDLLNAIQYYILASSLMLKRNIKKTDMIIHMAREVETHSDIFKVVNNYIDNLKLVVGKNLKRKEIFLKQLKNLYTDDYFEIDGVLKDYSFAELVSGIEEVVQNLSIIIKNGISTNSSDNDKIRRYKIYIGGDLLQRGLTFDKLITTFFTRWAKSGNMDTTLQRARWLGYRSEYFDLCKIFTPFEISNELTKLADSEIDLWEQIEQVEKKELEINDIIISAEESTLRPTRRSVADYKEIKFSKKWNSQREGSFALEDIEINNNLFNDLIKKYEFTSSNIGRLDGEYYAKYACISKEDIINLINDTRYIFDTGAPFKKDALINSIYNEKIILILMPDRDGRVRQRNFNGEGIIDALQQGADTIDENKRKFLGDRHVIIDKDSINIQVFWIHPKVNNVIMPEAYRQFMVSFYFPKVISSYRRG